jgi:hypothetical protein
MKTNSWETDLLNHYFTNAAVANVGDATGLRGSTVAGSLFLSLHETYPGEAGSQTTGETTYTSYARKSVARSGAEWTVSGNQVTNANAQAFPASTSAGPNNIYFVGIGRSTSGAGTLDYICPCGTQLGEGTATTADVITIPGLSGVAVNDEVAFFAPPKDALPTGITAGTIYFVKTVSGNDMTISATQGGATLDITAAGGVLAWKMIKLAVTNGVTPTIAASALALVEE